MLRSKTPPPLTRPLLTLTITPLHLLFLIPLLLLLTHTLHKTPYNLLTPLTTKKTTKLLQPTSTTLPPKNTTQQHCWSKQHPNLLSRSYLADSFWPFPPFRIVLEQTPGSCGESCKLMVKNRRFEPEFHVREVIASFLMPCLYKKRLFDEDCFAMDIGGNVGFMTGFMATLGAKVLTVEGQGDYAGLIRESVKVNCWEDSVDVRNVMLSFGDEGVGKKVNFTKGWRGIKTGSKRFEVNEVEVVSVESLIKGRRFDLVKIDLDSIDGKVLEKFVDLIEKKEVQVGTFVVELHHTPRSTLFRLQQKLGYDLYRLNMHEDKRLFDAKGHDVYSGFKEIELESWAEERFFQRFMTRLLYVKPEPNIEKWDEIMKRPRQWVPQFVITKEKIMENREEHGIAMNYPSEARNKSGWYKGKNGIPTSELYQGFFHRQQTD